LDCKCNEHRTATAFGRRNAGLENHLKKVESQKVKVVTVQRHSFRLVPGEDSLEIEALCRRKIARITSSTTKSIARTNQLVNPAVIGRRHRALHAAIKACCKVFEKTPVFARSGGSIPVVSTFPQVLVIQTMLMGFALPDDHIHVPNEKYRIQNLYRVIKASIWWEVSRQIKAKENAPAADAQTAEPSEAGEL
jgi:hypothetical protein